jgi:hypothetical protein
MPAPTDATPECGRSPDASPSATVWHECEPICGTWTWDASRHVFTASWENGAVATLTLVEFDDCQVIVDRNDYAGSSNGLTAEYVGARSGNSTQGTVTWHGRAGDVHSGMWNATW